MRSIPRFKTRIEIYVEVSDFNGWYDERKIIVDKFDSVFGIMRTDPRWIQFLKQALDIGNRLTEGTKKGGAYGIKCLSLKSFTNCQANDRSCSLMDFLAREIYKCDNDLLQFGQEFSEKITELLRYQTEGLLQEIQKKKSSFNKMKAQIENAKKSVPQDLGFITFALTFYEANVERIVSLEQQAEYNHSTYMASMQYLGELESKLEDQKSDEYLSDYVAIFTKIDQSYQKI